MPELHDLYGRAFEDKYVEYEAKAEKGEIWGHTMPATRSLEADAENAFRNGASLDYLQGHLQRRSPQDHVGVIHSSNLCTEITLNTGADETAVCNLGSVVLDSHLKSDGSIDHEKLRGHHPHGGPSFGQCHRRCFYPTEAAKTSNTRHRPIGLGVMGLQNSLYAKNIPFSSQQAVEFNDEFMEAICYYAYEASSDLASERGSYSSFRGSKWDRGFFLRIR